MSKIKHLFIFAIALAVLALFAKSITGSYFPNSSPNNLWFYSGMVMVIFSMFFVEPYYAAPTNVVSNSTSITLVLISIKESIPIGSVVYSLRNVAICYSSATLIIALGAILSSDSLKSKESLQNKISEILKTISMKFGSGKLLYSGMFLIFLLGFHSVQKIEILFLLIFWWAVVVLDPPRLVNSIVPIVKPKKSEIGEIFGVQSKKTFLAKLFSDKATAVRKFDLVKFNYSMREYSKTFFGIVFDSYFLNQEKWIKIIHFDEPSAQNQTLDENKVYMLTEPISDELTETIDRFVGVIIENTDIGMIKFEYSTKGGDIQEGDLVEVYIKGKNVYYQVINGITNVESIEAKNEIGYIRGEAVQLGLWNSEKYCFEKYGWVPEVNSLVLKAKRSESPVQLEDGEYELGRIPSTQFPAILDLNTAVSHHLAILGVTGCGKSFICREILKKLTPTTKVVCIDFTGEYIEKLADLNPFSLIKKDKLDELEAIIAQKQDNTSKSAQIDFRNKIQAKLTEYVTQFIESTNNISLFELPDLSNTSFIIEFTQLFLDAVFKYAKSHPGKKICIVIEEAHTVIPETNSLGDLGDYGSNKALVNKIGQIALQGRKYGVGFIIVAQRTANVSKTVLTQCNSIICFQAFDKTSYEFLGNYLGQDLVKILPNLKPYHAIVAGKGFKSTIPMIVDLTRK